MKKNEMLVLQLRAYDGDRMTAEFNDQRDFQIETTRAKIIEFMDFIEDEFDRRFRQAKDMPANGKAHDIIHSAHFAGRPRTSV